MEIKDLATVAEIRSELADVRGGARARFGNIKIQDVSSYNASHITNGSVWANTDVRANRSAGVSLSDIGSVVTYAPVNTVSQTSGNAFDISSILGDLNIAQ